MVIREMIHLIPVMILAAGILIILILIALRRHHTATFFTTAGLMTAALIAAFFTRPDPFITLEDLFRIDAFGYFYMILILLTTLAVAVFSYYSLDHFYPEKRKEEFYPLLMTASLGAIMMAFSIHFISFFVSLEVLSVSLYGLIAYHRTRAQAVEAGLKYLILAALSTAFMLMGMALVYAVSGSMAFSSLWNPDFTTPPLMFTGGIALIITGIGFKLAAVPFHIWTPDVYEGASSPVTAFIASVSKGSIVAVLIRFFIMADLYSIERIVWIFTLIAIFSMLIGNLLALLQNNVKRILAYSSIAHFGYLLVAVIAGGSTGAPAATFYLLTYMITIVSAFGLVTLISQSEEEAVDIEDYRGLYWKKPFLAAAFSLSLLSLAGIPLTAGFIGKFLVLLAGAGAARWLLAIILVIGSVIGLYYYLRLIVVMIRPEEDAEGISPSFHRSFFAGSITLCVLILLILWLGIYPRWIWEIIRGLGII